MDFLQKDSLPKSSDFLVIITLSFLIFIIFASVQGSFSDKAESLDISIVNSSFIRLSNSDTNQVKANVEYTLKDEKMQNQLVNGVMEVYASNGTLIRTTSVPSGFTLQGNGGEQSLKTTIHDKSLQSVSIKIVFTDLSKEIPLSNTISDKLKLEEAPKNSVKGNSIVNKTIDSSNALPILSISSARIK